MADKKKKLRAVLGGAEKHIASQLLTPVEISVIRAHIDAALAEPVETTSPMVVVAAKLAAHAEGHREGWEAGFAAGVAAGQTTEPLSLVKCPCGGEGCEGVEDGLRHQCGGPQEACGVQGCMECGRARAMIHGAGVRADNAERRENASIAEIEDAVEAARVRGAKVTRDDGRPKTLPEVVSDVMHDLLSVRGALNDTRAVLARVQKERDEARTCLDDLNRLGPSALKNAGHPNPQDLSAAYAIGWLEERLKEARADYKNAREFSAAETEHANRWSQRAHKAEAEVKQLKAEVETQAKECERQMQYGVEQHEAAQDALRARDAAVEAFHEATRLRGLIQQARVKAEDERDAALAELKRMRERPVESEFLRLDQMWQALVRERDEAVVAMRLLKAALSDGKRWCMYCQNHDGGCAHCVGWNT